MAFNRRTLMTVLAAAAVASAIAPMAIAQSSQERGRAGKLLEELNLTATQQEQVDAIRAEHREQMASILTDEQRAQLQTARESGQRRRGALQSLDLSEDQKGELKSLRESTRDRVSAVLTDDQREQLEAKRAEWKSRRSSAAF
ncbi:MAG: Spy/CpxP family protein refolding chaperone [Cyanobacteria bacterium J06639_1]